MSVIISMET